MTSAEEFILNCEEKMCKTVEDIKLEMVNIRTGKPNPLLLDKITADYYGTPTPIRQMANIASADGQSLSINPFDKTALKEIEKAILKSDLGLTPNNDGNVIRINFPPLTEQRRKELVKQVKKVGEDYKVAIRNIRRDSTDAIKKLKKSENLPEDEVKAFSEDIQKLTDQYIKELDSVVSEKEKEVLAV